MLTLYLMHLAKLPARTAALLENKKEWHTSLEQTRWYCNAAPVAAAGVTGGQVEVLELDFLSQKQEKAGIGLCREQWKRIEQCQNPEDRKRRFMGCLLAAYALQSQGGDGVLPAYLNGPFGKPYLAAWESFFFNLSHSGELAVCAVADQEVGIDVQQKRSLSQRIADRFFTAQEKVVLAQASPKEKEALFYRIWSAKEAYIKLTGQGLGQGLATFTADVEKGRILDSGKAQSAIRLIEVCLSMQNEYQITICCEDRAEELEGQCPHRME